MTAIGAQRKHVTLPTDFRSLPESGCSPYSRLTARFAPQQPTMQLTSSYGDRAEKSDRLFAGKLIAVSECRAKAR
jgi:hypothetical protein